MSFFREARGVSIGQGTFNVVTGNQTINTYKHYIVERQDKKRTIYDEFPDIQRGLVRRLKDVDRKDLLLRWNKRLKRIEVEFMVERTISTAKINGDTSSSFTVVSYKGQDAQKAWKKDFLRFFETICTTKMQLFGINRSSVPLLIFYGELVPLAHFWDRLGELGQSYAYTLAWDKWECSPSRVWIDTEQGILVHGLEGPDHNLFHFFITVEPLPSSVELLLEEDVCFRYFSRFPLVKKFDMRVIEVFHCASEIEEGGPWIVKRPCVVSSRTIFVIAVGREVWTVYGCLDNQVLMPDGRARFTLTSDEDSTSTFGFYSSKYRDETHWLSQAPSVFHRLGISLNKDLSSYTHPARHLLNRINWKLATMLGGPTYILLPLSTKIRFSRHRQPHLVLRRKWKNIHSIPSL
ncbi:hypothetical protein E1B28_005187 [Marasmius oreades]|uniref:Uncharacterized protein n=1 Tax=Marasmius oreades TaxID=181124 RepID=A0A9P7V086_9AGAR|nr:uncharacterized protein E1B28_005187 [Marasmius oreades]KAG7097876.1 hypothetical protein E1B28_005187 [Marasmius oreades]